MRRTWSLFFIVNANISNNAGRATQYAKRQREFKIPLGGGRETERAHQDELRRHGPKTPKTRQWVDPFDSNKQRNLFVQRDEKQDEPSLTPQRGSHRGLDAACYEPKKLSRDERRQRMREALETNSDSSVSFCESDVNLGGAPGGSASGQTDDITISGESSMFSSLIRRGELKSRQGGNTWSSVVPGTPAERQERQIQRRDENTLHNRQWFSDESEYQMDFDDPALEHAYESVQHSVSIYTHRKLFLDGLFGVERFITKEEERALCEELLRLTQDPAAGFVAEESRYCVNLYERTLGVVGKDPLAMSMEGRAPLLTDILRRAFTIGLIPSMPNLAQVSEFVGAYSGYPLHLKNQSVGPFVGMLSLVSSTVLHMQHINLPWAPRILVHPRSIYVAQAPCLHDYRMGFSKPHQPFQTFRHATRLSKDYRIEILFACVDVKQSKFLHQAENLTTYSNQHLLPSNPLKQRTTSVPFSRVIGEAAASTTPTDGEALRREALASGGVGARHRELPTSTSESLRGRVERLSSTLSTRREPSSNVVRGQYRSPLRSF